MICGRLALGGGLLASALATSQSAHAVANGVDVAPGALTYQVSLETDAGHGCGGTIIGDSWVLTAAHCLQTTRVRSGSINRNQGGQTHRIAETYPHPLFDPDDLTLDRYDIGLVRIDGTFPQELQRVPLATDEISNAVTPGTNAIVSGWGRTSTTWTPGILQGAWVTLVDPQKCQERGLDATYSFCSHDLSVDNVGTGPCQGDSGGGLIVDYNKQFYHLATFRSTLPGTCRGDFVAVYASTKAYRDWINNVLSGRVAAAVCPVGYERYQGQLDANGYAFVSGGWYDTNRKSSHLLRSRNGTVLQAYLKIFENNVWQIVSSGPTPFEVVDSRTGRYAMQIGGQPNAPYDVCLENSSSAIAR